MRSSTRLLLMWALLAPLLLEWSLGTSHVLLDRAALPAAFLLGVPELASWPGLLLVLGLAALATWRGSQSVLLWRCSLALGTVGGLAAAAPTLALGRPLLWLIVLPLILVGLPARGASPWRFPLHSLPLLGALCWALACRLPPWGEGLLGVSVEDWLSGLVTATPPWAVQGVSALALVGAALLLSRRVRPSRLALLVGALVGMLLELTFGTGLTLPLAGLAGGLVGAWALPFREGAAEPLLLCLPVLALGGLLGLAGSLTERWACPEVSGEELRFLSRDSGIEDMAVIPGNLPFLVLLREEGSVLERLGPTGVVNETRELDPAGGFLVSSGELGSSIARVLATPDGARIEWWSPSSMERTHSSGIAGACVPGDGAMLPGSARVFVSCRESGDIWSATPGEPAGALLVEGSGSASRLVASGLPVRFWGGAAARFTIEALPPAGGASTGPVLLGPWASSARASSAGLLIAGGPTGQVEIRGADPLWTFGVDDPGAGVGEAGRAALRNTVDRVRVPGWPSSLAWSPYHSAVWVTSLTSGEVTLLDPEVTWHQKTASIGAPARKIVVDPDSGSLFGVNRCGLFELRVRSIFPWESTGDVEPPTESAPAPGEPSP